MDKNIINSIDNSIEKSMSIIETVCPRNNVCMGIKARDTYHTDDNSKFSMFTGCEMLWAITSSGIYSKTHYLTVELLTTINTELGNGYFENQDRMFEKAFILLAMTCAGQPIVAPIYVKTVKKILDEQKDNGAWGSYSEGEIDIRATALSLISLTECCRYIGKTDTEPFNSIEDKIQKTCKWLCQQYTEKGYCKRKIINLEDCTQIQEFTYGIELTAWVTYALLCAVNFFDIKKDIKDKLINKIRLSVNWMLALDIKQVAQVPEIEIERYKKGNELKNHEYGSGSLEILILALIEYINSDIYEYTKGIEEYLSKAILRLLENEKEGKWYDKNSDSYNRMWPVSYAIKVLTAYKEYLLNKEKFRNQLKKNVKLSISRILTKLHKYIFNWPLIIIYFLIGLVGLYFHEFLKARVEFINSTIIGFTGLMLSAIGILLSVYYGRKGK